MDDVSARSSRVVILGGGPGGYEAALVAAHLGAEVTVVERDGLGGAAVLTDCVPSKTLISTADYMGGFGTAHALGVHLEDAEGDEVADAVADLREVNPGCSTSPPRRAMTSPPGWPRSVCGCSPGGGCSPPRRRCVPRPPTGVEELEADVVLVATGATPRVMATARPDGERILTWQQIYDLDTLPERLVVVGSGVTGAELAQAYLGLGSRSCSSPRATACCPARTPTPPRSSRTSSPSAGMEVLGRSRMAAVERTADGVLVRLEDGREVAGSHALLAVGLGAAHERHRARGPRGRAHGIRSRRRRPGLAHVGAWRLRRRRLSPGCCRWPPWPPCRAASPCRTPSGDAVAPLNLRVVSANIFTDPEIATVGVSQKDVDDEVVDAEVLMLPLSRNARAKMLGITDGFVKLFAQKGSGAVVGGVVVAPRASELIFPVTLAVQHRLNVDQVASTFTVYPSLSGSIAEAARRLHATDDGLARPTAPPTGGDTVKKKVRAAAVIAVVTTAVSQARDYAREHPDEAGGPSTRSSSSSAAGSRPEHGAYLDKGGAALRQGLGLPARDPSRASGPVGTATTDPDPDTTEPPQRREADDPVAPNPSPGTSDDPQPRRGDDEPAPLTPGERAR